MNGTIRTLIVLFVIQIGLAAAVLLQDDGLATFAPDEKFLPFDLAELTKIELHEPDKKLVIGKKENQWVVASSYDFPISDSKKAILADKLFGLKRPYPVGSTPIAAKSFEVSKDKFQKKIALFNGDVLQDAIYLGTSPGFKKVHAKRESEKETYAVEFSAYDLQLSPGAWYDRNFLKVDRGDLKSIQRGDLSVTFEDSTPSIGELADDEQLDTEAIEKFIRSTTQLTFNDLLGTEAAPKYNADTPYFSYTVTRNDGSARTYSFSKPTPEKAEETPDAPPVEYYVLKLSDAPYYFRIATANAQSIAEVERAGLVKEKEQPEPAESEGEQTTAVSGEEEPSSPAPASQ